MLESRRRSHPSRSCLSADTQVARSRYDVIERFFAVSLPFPALILATRLEAWNATRSSRSTRESPWTRPPPRRGMPACDESREPHAGSPGARLHWWECCPPLPRTRRRESRFTRRRLPRAVPRLPPPSRRRALRVFPVLRRPIAVSNRRHNLRLRRIIDRRSCQEGRSPVETQPATTVFPALGTTVSLLLTNPRRLE